MRLIIGFLVLSVFGCTNREVQFIENEQLAIIPRPNSVEQGTGVFIWDKNTTITANSIAPLAKDFLIGHLNNATSLKLTESKTNPTITISIDSTITNTEGYILNINSKKISIAAKTPIGAFHGVQTLRQLLPAALEKKDAFTEDSFTIPTVAIKDAPAFAYRGMHLDVSRHFFPPEKIKAYIDMLSLLKLNTFHWHLTDDQGWRIEIKKYPELVTKAAYRLETLVGHYNDTPQQFDNTRYGGYYTQEEVKSIVAYAQAKHITVIPEIEMPGHASAAISAYPELGCTQEQIPVATSWGVFEDIFCPKPATFKFLQNVLDEVIALFPSQYIHIGGDEAPKARWEACAHCQNLIKQQGLANTHELQSYFIRTIESYLNSKGRQIIGWDEILEGGLAPNATVMSWRGTAGAVAAAKSGHNVILTPTSHAYFDYYQANNPDEPLAIGGYLPLKKVYSFSPYPTEMPKEDYKYVLGAQGNVWTEYMKTWDKLEYMAYPRTMAMSEVVWSGPSSSIDQDYSNFLLRLEHFFNRLDTLEVNYGNHIYQVKSQVSKINDSIYYNLTSQIPGKEIRYGLNGEQVTKTYTNPIAITANTVIESVVWGDNKGLGKSHLDTVRAHKGILATIAINKQPHPAYSSGGIAALNNGISGSSTRYGDNEWLGFWGDNLELNITFNSQVKLDSITIRFYHAPGQWIYAPETVQVSGEVLNKGYFSTAGYPLPKTNSLKSITLQFPNESFGALKLKIPNYGTIPDGQQGAGNKAWTFIDEIIID